MKESIASISPPPSTVEDGYAIKIEIAHSLKSENTKLRHKEKHEIVVGLQNEYIDLLFVICV